MKQKENLKFTVEQSWKEKESKTFFGVLENLESFLHKYNISKFLFLFIFLLHIKLALNFRRFIYNNNNNIVIMFLPVSLF